MKTFRLLSIFLLAFTASYAQSGLKGTIKDAATNDPLIGVNLLLSNGKGTVTDTAGNFFIPADSGTYTMQITYVGYLTQSAKAIVKKNKPTILSFQMESRTLTAVEVVADIAKTRETPVAFSNIDAKKIQEELASRDIPMLLNTTPGVYATQQGGGTGDSRITIRGFNQQNIGVLVDGIPVNDMENSQVYWSNWDGLGDITRNIQVQRGMGASKLAVASVGGTINIITKGLDAKKAISYSQEYGSDMLLKETLAMTTGRMKGDWGITVSGTRKTGNGWVDQTPVQEWAYFVKVEKRIKNHLISAGANAAPQSHGQRTYQSPVSSYDKTYAAKLGIDTSTSKVGKSFGLAYNSQWGPIDRWTGNIDKNGNIVGDTTSHNKSKLNSAVNYFNKPLFNLSDYWTINDKLYMSTVLYASYGSGGGTSMYSGLTPSPVTGQYNFQSVYNYNYTHGYFPTIAPGHLASNFIKSSVNNHQWYGGLITLTFKPTKEITITAGPDVRWYKGSHFYQVHDLLGGDYILDYANGHQTSAVKHVGDMFNHDYDGYVKYGGLFVQTEYVKEKMSAFVTLTGVETSYQRVDNFDTTGHSKSPTIQFPGYSVKAGANYNLSEHHNVYVNAGYIVKAPPFNNVFYNSNVEEWNVKSQQISSVELGYGFKSRMLAANLNVYYTDWRNKPLDFTPTYTDPVTGNAYSYNVNGINALHKGMELDLLSKPIKQVTLGGIISIGDWRWNSKDTAKIYDLNNKLVTKVPFDATGVHVGNTAQSQFGFNVRYEPIKHLYFKLQWTYFARIYSAFDPTSLNTNSPGYKKNPNGDHDSWRIPDYQLFDLHAGYMFQWNHFDFNFAAHVLNLFNTEYIADATDLGYFDASHSNVFFGQGRHFLLSMKITFK
jgi:iron complex outermembrane receptor protein